MDHCRCCYIFFSCSNNFLSSASAYICNIYSSVVLCPKLLTVQWDFSFSYTWFDVVKLLLSYWSSAYHIAHYNSHPSAFNFLLSLSLQILIYAYRFFSNLISSNYVPFSFSCLIFDMSSQWPLSLLLTWCIISMLIPGFLGFPLTYLLGKVTALIVLPILCILLKVLITIVYYWVGHISNPQTNCKTNIGDTSFSLFYNQSRSWYFSLFIIEYDIQPHTVRI